MLYELLSPYGGDLNLFSYITFRTGLALVTALILTLILGAPMIGWLRRKQEAPKRTRPSACRQARRRAPTEPEPRSPSERRTALVRHR